jgi:hypothetical protein
MTLREYLNQRINQIDEAWNTTRFLEGKKEAFKEILGKLETFEEEAHQ